MITIRKTIKWVLILLVVGAATAGGYAFYLWNHSDEMLRQALLDRIHETAPGWEVSISGANFDIWGKIHVHDLSLKDSDGISPLLDVPEAILIVDREHLADPNTPIQNVRWIRPKLHLARDPQGVWNFRKLPPLKLPKNRTVPEFHAERMALSVVFHDSPGGSRPTTLEDVNLQMIRKGAREFLLKATAKFPHSDGIKAEGSWQIDGGTFDVKGDVKNLAIDGALSQLASEFSPEYRAGLTRLEGLLEKYRHVGPPGDAETESDPLPLQSTAADAVARLGLSAVGDVRFHVAQWRPGAEREYRVAVNVARGEMKRPPFPYPLQDLQGKILLDNTQILLSDFSARSGVTHITLDQGRVQEKGELRPADFDLQITALPLDDRIPGMLPPAMKRVYDDVHPTSGEVDVHLYLEYNGRDRWQHECDLVARNGTVTHRRFDYPIDHVEGTIQQRGDTVDVVMHGRAGTQRVDLVGRVKNPGDEAASEFVVKTAGIPLDERLRSHCPEKFRKVIDELQAQGELDGTVRFQRAAGRYQPVLITVDARFRNGTVNCLRFPYPLSGVSGEFRGSGDDWTFEDFTGRHGPAEFSCRGGFHRNAEGRLELELDFSLLGAMLDRQLLAALPEDARSVWREFSPDGGLNIQRGTIFWSPDFGGKLRIANLEAELFDAKLTLSKFPFPITDVAARISYDGTKATIRSFSGRHDEMTIRVLGGFATYASDGEWRVRLQPLYVDDLEATPPFKRALPERMRLIVDALNPRGKQSISGMLEFRGVCGGKYPVTAAWETVTVYSGTTINAGVDLRDMYGVARFSGEWDGTVAVGNGEIDLKSVKVLDHLLTEIHGPASINGTRLVLGSPPLGGNPRREEPDPAQRISAGFIDGRLGLDAAVDLGETMRYHVWITLKDGNLERYAKSYLSPGNNRLAGTMNGNIELKGEKADPRRLTGTGKLVISPAALYDLPVIVQIFNVLQFIPPNKRAFDQALFVFDVKDSIVHFGHIDLRGDAIRLQGLGTVNFDTKVALNFRSQMGRRQVPIPIIKELVNEISKGWVKVSVAGTLKTPETTIVPFPLPEALNRRTPQRR